MCGVVALLAPIEQSQRESLVQKMCAILGHRGPDGEGIWSGAGITLGHRRLAIIDLSDAAAQPMRRGSFCITYNGEFYNYLSKRSELELRGLSQPWRGQGDTEVLLELASQRGMPAALDELNGMFAFALWDEHEQALWLARDRFGEKPLYCLLDGATAIVASELKAIVHAARTLGIAIGVERDTLACYLADAEHEVGELVFVRRPEVLHRRIEIDELSAIDRAQAETLGRTLVLAGGELLPYRPQRRALNLLACGERYAIASWGAWSAEGAWVWRWKDRIDRGFMQRFGSDAAEIGRASCRERVSSPV